MTINNKILDFLNLKEYTQLNKTIKYQCLFKNYY